MKRYSLSFDIGDVYGERLERLAAFRSLDDINHFAAMLLWEAIDKNISRMNAELFEAFEGDIRSLRSEEEIQNQIDLYYRKVADKIWGTEDELPF
jgi:hypothetical protein